MYWKHGLACEETFVVTANTVTVPVSRGVTHQRTGETWTGNPRHVLCPDCASWFDVEVDDDGNGTARCQNRRGLMSSEETMTNDWQMGPYGPIKRVDGLKTGHTEEAGFCLVSSAKRDDMRLIAVVMGAEGDGMRRLTREHCDVLVKIPMVGTVSSLNVSVATGICLFEVLRQRSL